MNSTIDLQKVAAIIDGYGCRREALIAIMQDIQAEYKYLSEETLELIAEKLDISIAKVYSVATFYATDIFHNLELEKRNMLELREKNLKLLSQAGFYNFSEYGKDEKANWPSALTNKGRTRTLTPERLAEINSIAKTKHIINEYYEEKHPNTRITNNKVEGNITVNVYGNIVSYGQSFEEEDKEAYETGLNVMEMSCEEAIRAFVDRHIQEVKAVYLKLGISYD